MNYLNTKTVLMAFACLSLLSCKDPAKQTQQTVTENTQENYISDKLVADPENQGEKMLLGKVRYADFKNDSLFPWMSESFEAYTPDSITLIELKKEQMKELTPLKLQAYERLTLFLDRVSPDNLVVRLSKRGQSAAQLRAELVGTISGEYNHNISQQIYVSDDAWKMIQAVKEQIIGLVEQCYSECAEGESGPQLGKRILTRLMEQNAAPTQNAIHLLKKEIEIAL